MAKIAVIGLWHLGSVYSACLAELGHEVIGLEEDTAALGQFNNGKAPLFEPGLDDLLAKNIKSGSLKFTNDWATLSDREFIFVAFDTPVDEQDRSDLTPIVRTIDQIGKFKESPVTVVVSSQVPVGTCHEFAKRIKQLNPELKFDIAYMPENLRLGTALEVFLKADRFVVGSDNPEVYGRLELVLKGTGAPLIKVALRSAEMAKHALNSFLATCVSFTNELADVCELVGADVTEVAAALKSDERIGQKAYLNAGLGFAGGTLARDLVTLAEISHKSALKLPVIEGTLATNGARVDKAVQRVVSAIGSVNSSTIVTVLGLTYKPGTSTLRRSISLEIIAKLRSQGVQVKAYDPKADLSELKQPDFEISPTLDEAAKGSSGLIIVTGWPEFKEINYAPLLEVMAKPVILDLINFASAKSQASARELGFKYFGTGIGEIGNET